MSGQLHYTQMHALGNKFIVVDAVRQRVAVHAAWVRKLADRDAGGIGFDQLLLLEPPPAALEPPPAANVDFLYRVFNADGSEVSQCGNGARCAARFALESGLAGDGPLVLETRDGRRLRTRPLDGEQWEVDLGLPDWEPANIPFSVDARSPTATYPITVGERELTISALSVGNPHAVLFVDGEIDDAMLAALGPGIERHAQFPQQSNVGFAQVLRRDSIRLRVHERGVGETPACGSGACAAVIGGQLRGLLDDAVTVHMRGGPLQVHWAGAGHSVRLSGSTSTGRSGSVPIDADNDADAGPRRDRRAA